MYNPAFEIPALPAPLEAVFEVNLEDAIHDQYLAWRDQSYGSLMMAVCGSRSEVEISAARQLLLDKEWKVKYSEFFEDAYAYVQASGGTWMRLFKEDCRHERLAMVGKGETELESLFTDLMDQMDEAWDAAHEQEDRAYAPRSAGPFARSR